MGTSAPLPQLDTIDSPSDFQHNPLNRQAPSIRLVRIRAASSLDATIHCDIRHASTTSIYICLSYVWGEIDRGHWIFLNGRRFWIRENLWHFLRSARQKFHIRSEWLWIDALCIDQTNNDERTHQVQQMGRIFSSAVKVISWLGMSDEIAEYFEDRSNLDLVHFKESCHAYWNPRSLDPKLRCFYACEYWSRAWITQEFALARRNTFMARDVEVDCEQLEKTYARDWTMVERVNFEMSFGLRGRSLIYLLDRYHYKKSQIPRDRVFSLLALCGEGSDLKADYGLPHVDLARDILQSCKESMCLCSTRMVQDVLNLTPDFRKQWKPEYSYAPNTPSTRAEEDGSPRHVQNTHTTSPQLSKSASSPHSRIFAHITLPTVPSTTPKWQSSPSIALARSLNTKGRHYMSATLDLSHVCDRCSGCITFTVDSATRYTSYQYIKQHSSSAIFAPRAHYLAFACSINLSADNRTCEIGLSLDVLFGIAAVMNLSKAAGCCRVIDEQGSPRTKAARQRVLRPCKG